MIEKEMVEKVTITSLQAGQRLDNFLIRICKGVPKSRLYRAVRSGEVRINGKRCKVLYKLQEGDIVRIPPLRMRETMPKVAPPSDVLKQLKQSILYEDAGIIVINKWAGMAVHGGTGVSWGVIDAYRRMPEYKHYLELAHRLDKGTSGCLILAKKPSALRRIHKMLLEKEMKKTYWLLVKGEWKRAMRRIRFPLKKSTLPSGQRIVEVDDEGKQAETHFSLREDYGEYLWLQAQLLTGRTHQIRVHAKACGCPILGDDRYGDQAENRHWHKQGHKRLCLHAHKIVIPRWNNGEDLCITADVDNSWQSWQQVLTG